jgi:hypothetical protein
VAKGIAIPMKSKNGRLELLGEDDYIEQLVFTGLQDGESENPFQDVGLGEFMVFAINDEQTDGEIRARIVSIFAELEADQLARLDDPDTDLAFEDGTGPSGQERRVTIKYTNMETQERLDIEVPIPPAE